jgi:hypothetical protein
MKKFIASFIISYFLCAPAISKDLSGNNLDCTGSNAMSYEHVAFKFLSKSKVKIRYIMIENQSKHVVEYLSDEVTKYKLEEKYDENVITVFTKHLRVPTVGNTTIYRSDLQVSYPTYPICEIVDYDPFEKFEQYKELIEASEPKKKENKL